MSGAFEFCAICGAYFSATDNYYNHRCPELTLRGIDASHVAANRMDAAEGNKYPCERATTYHSRLAEGFKLGRLGEFD